MYYPEPEPHQNTSLENLKLLETASLSPLESCENDPSVQEAFETGLRQLAEDIVEYHPSLAHVLLGMSSTSCDIVHGQN